MHATNRVAIVTGGASGIGRALCEALASNRVTVVVADIAGAGAQSVADILIARGYRATARQVDVARKADVEQLVDDIVATYGRIDYMFNNAGIGLIAELRDMTEDHWRRIIDVNMWGVIYGTGAAYRHMVHQQSGHIVNTASAAGLFPTAIFGTAYSTAKYAVVGFSTSLRTEAASLGVNVSVACPGVIQTGIFDATTRVNVSRAGALRMFGAVTPLDAATCARIILRGVERHQAIIPITTATHLTWRLYRFAPGWYDFVGRYAARIIRRNYRQVI